MASSPAPETILLLQRGDEAAVNGTDDVDDDDVEDIVYESDPIVHLAPTTSRAMSQRQGSCRSTKTCCVISFVVAALVVGLVGLASKSHVAKFLLVNAAVGGEMGQMVADMDTSASMCADPVKHACGHYATTASVPRTKLVDLKRRVGDEVLLLAGKLPPPPTWGWQQFLQECMAEPDGTDLALGKPVQWRLERGLPAAGVMFGRTRSIDLDRRERVATIFDLANPGPCHPTISSCEATNLTNLAPLDEPQCLASVDPEAMCARLVAAANQPLAAALTGRSWCVDEALVLWPSATSAAYEKYMYPEQLELDATKLFEVVRDTVARRLAKQRQAALAARVQATVLHTRHNAPPEQYKMTAASFVERWGSTRKQHYEANMALQFYGSNQWDISGTHVGLFYDPLFNAVYLPAATSAHSWSPFYMSRAAKLGYLFGLELAGAIASASNAPASASAALVNTRKCYADTYELPADRVADAISHRVATSAVASLVGTASTEPRLVCNPTCVLTSAASRSYTLMIQSWCSTQPADENEDIALAIGQTNPILAAWQCPSAEAVRTCATLGA